jgi:hypothetical protein
MGLGGLYGTGSLLTVVKGLPKYKLDLVGVQEVRWDEGGTEPAGEHTFSYGTKMRTMNLGIGSLYIR